MARMPDHEVDKLLAEGRIGGPGRERIFERVLRDVDRADVPLRGARWSRVLAALLAAGSVAGGIVLFARFTSRAGIDGFRAKGTDPVASVSLLCGGDDGVCRPGERLFFRVGPTPRHQWLVAYAESDDEAHAPRIWLSPGAADAAGAATIEIPPADAPSIVRRAVELDRSIAPGRYKVSIWLLDHPPTAAELRAPLVDRARQTAPLVIQ